MTDIDTITHDTSSSGGSRTHDCERKLRRVLRLNALNSAVSGTVMAVAAAAIERLLDTGHSGSIRIVGLALLPFAAFCWWVAAGSVDRLRRETPFIVVGDIGWSIASVVTVALGWYSDRGVVAVLAMAVVVDVFAVIQFVAWRRLRTTR